MGKLDLYKVPLKSLSEGVAHTYEYQLDNKFFAALEGGEFQQGDVYVWLDIVRTGNTFELDFELEGSVQVPCDRCLDDMTIEVETLEKLYVKLGSEYNDEDADVIVIPEVDGEINIAWNMYEYIALSLPIKRVHPDGECNQEMAQRLEAVMLIEIDEDEELIDRRIEQEGNEEVDPRWEELKKLIEKNN